jgi:hypothetical protein
MTNIEREYLRIGAALIEVVLAWLVGSQVLLRGRNQEFISAFERRYARLTSATAAVLMVVDATLAVLKYDSASIAIFQLTTVAVIAHYVVVVVIHGRSLQINGQLKPRRR